MGASWVLVIWSVAIVIAVVKRSSQNAPLLENYHSCDFSKKHPWVLPSETSLPGHSVCNFNLKEEKEIPNLFLYYILPQSTIYWWEMSHLILNSEV